MKHLRSFLPLLAAIALLLVIFTLWVPQNRFLTAGNLIDLAQQISVNAILAFGLTLVILIGGIDLSVGAVVALAGVVCVSVLGAAGPLGGLAAGLGAAILLGVANGTLRSPHAHAAVHHHAGHDARRRAAWRWASTKAGPCRSATISASCSRWATRGSAAGCRCRSS